MAEWLVLILALFSFIPSSQSVSCSNLTPCRELTQQHCFSSQVLCVGYSDCKRCARRVCDEGNIICSQRGATLCAVERGTAGDRENNCMRPNDPSITEACQKSTGQDCDWYPRCMYRLFPKCSGSENYALNYGQRFCEEYGKIYNDFTPNGKIWVDRVKKCLQDEILPLLSLPDSSCAEVKKKAFDSHTPCYVEPLKGGKSSVCLLGCKDLVRVLGIGAKAVVNGAFWKSFQQAYSVRGKCLRRSSSTCFKVIAIPTVAAEVAASFYAGFGVFRLLRFATPLLRVFGKRAIGCDGKCIAEEMTGKLFNKTGLSANSSIEWFAFPEEVKEELEISVLITNTDLLTAYSKSELHTAHLSLQAAADAFFNTIIERKEVIVDGRVRRIEEVSACGDLECDRASSKFVELKHVDNGAKSQQQQGLSVGFLATLCSVSVVFATCF